VAEPGTSDSGLVSAALRGSSLGFGGFVAAHHRVGGGGGRDRWRVVMRWGDRRGRGGG
jgi:hypothetical protein